VAERDGEANSNPRFGSVIELCGHRLHGPLDIFGTGLTLSCEAVRHAFPVEGEADTSLGWNCSECGKKQINMNEILLSFQLLLFLKR
jgi:hypothetical protein